MPDREAALPAASSSARTTGSITATREDFQRSDLTHLLAVSGENVILLCVLAWPLLALLGLPLRARLIGALCLIAIYVPVTGAGPVDSARRGDGSRRADRRPRRPAALALVRRPARRRPSRSALNPRADGDVGWQLSFAAVIGIMLWAKRLGVAARRRPDGAGRRARRWRRRSR